MPNILEIPLMDFHPLALWHAFLSSDLLNSHINVFGAQQKKTKKTNSLVPILLELTVYHYALNL